MNGGVTLSKSVKNIVDVEKIQIEVNIKVMQSFAAWKSISLLANNTSQQIDKTQTYKNLNIGDYTYSFTLTNPNSFDFKLTKQENLQIAYCGMIITVTNQVSKPDCHYNCQECGKVGCKTCQQGRDPKLCSCGIGFTEELFNPICQPKPTRCPLECKKCQTNSDICQECDSSLFRKINELGKCVCIQGYYEDNLTSFACKKCDDSCNKCEKRSNFCLVCTDVSKVADNKGVCTCKETLFELQNKQCGQCRIGCLKCNDETTCYTCNTNKNFKLSNNNCICKDSFELNAAKDACVCKKGFFEEAGECKKCDDSCLDCTSAKICLECTLPETQLNSQGACVCKNKDEYLDKVKMKCSKCKETCQTCSDGNTCDSCIPYKKFIYDSQNRQCICNQGYFLLNNQCEKCFELCETCTDFKVCSACAYKDTSIIALSEQSCSSISLKQNSNCVCSKGFYFDLVLKKCQNCPPKCSQCYQNDLNAIICSECMNNQSQFINDFDNICKCQNGYYQDEVDPNQCKPCQNLCQSCEGFDKCYKCKYPSLIINNGKCECRQGQYYDEQTQQCKNCLQNCKTCINSSTCSKCLDDQMYYLNDNQQCQCQEGYFPIQSENLIDKDMNPINNTIGRLCEACDYMCQKCENKQKCSSCKYEQTTLTQQGNTCECSKGKAFDPVTKQCQDCPSGCSKCNDQKICSECFQNGDEILYKLENGKCLCNDGYFLNSDKVCQKCNYMCKTCLNDKFCTSCKFSDTVLKPFNRQSTKNNQFQQQSNSLTSQEPPMSCVCAVQNQFFKEDKCQNCMPSCGSCQNLQTCITCEDNIKYQLDESSNKCVCALGYYWKERDQICTDCANQFILQNKCVDSCPPNLSTYKNRECVMNCPEGFVSVNKICLPTFCNQNCKICNKDKIHCDACNSNFYLMQDNYCKICDKTNEFYDPSVQKCIICNPACYGCKGITTYDCIECKFAMSPFSRYECVLACGQYEYIKQHPKDPRQAICSTCFRQPNNQCKDQCYPGDYYDEEFNCKKCHQNCKECNGGSQKDCTMCQQGFFLLDNGVCSKCEFGKYFDEKEEMCKNCHFSCQECEGGSDTNCKICNYSLFKSPYTNRCISKVEYNQEKQQFLKFQEYGCISNRYSECENSIRIAQETSNFLKLGTSISSAFTCVTGLFFPSISFIAWQYVENHQVLGNLRNKYQLPLGISIHHLKVSKYFNIINLFYDPSDNKNTPNHSNNDHSDDDSDDDQLLDDVRFQVPQNYNVNNLYQKNFSQAEPQQRLGKTKSNQQTFNFNHNTTNLVNNTNIKFDQIGNQVSDQDQNIKQKNQGTPQTKLVINQNHIFYNNCLVQLIILATGLIIVLLLFYYGSRNQTAQKVFLYLRWNFIIRLFMLFSNDFISGTIKFFQNEDIKDSTEKILSLIAIIAVWIIYLFIHIKGFIFLFSIKQFSAQQKKQSYKVLYENVKELTLMHRLYFFFFEIKKILSIIFELVLENEPQQTMISLITLSSLFLFYLVVFKPIFKGRILAISIIIEAFNLLFFTIIILIFKSSDSSFYPQCKLKLLKLDQILKISFSKIVLIHAFIAYEAIMVTCVLTYLLFFLIDYCRKKKKDRIQELQNGNISLVGLKLNVEFQVVLEQNQSQSFVKPSKIKLPFRKQPMFGSMEKLD